MPAPVELRRGAAVRVRAVHFAGARTDLVLELRQSDSTFAAWKPAARDAIELPAAEKVLQPARASIGIGQIRDYEFAPLRAGDYRFEVRTPGGVLLAVLPLRVF